MSQEYQSAETLTGIWFLSCSADPSGPQVIPKFSGFFMPFFVYIIKCLQDGTYYKGSIENYLQRLNYQNAGKSRYISAKVPWKLIYDEEKPDK